MTSVSPMLPTRVLAGANTKTISVTPAVQASPNYSDGDVIGGKMTLSDLGREAGGSGAIVAGHVYSLVDIAVSIPIRVVLFNADPANSTFTENAALNIDPTDLSKIVGVINLDQRLDLGTPVLLTPAQSLLLPFTLPDDQTDGFAVAVAGGAIDLGGVADLTFSFGVHTD